MDKRRLVWTTHLHMATRKWCTCTKHRNRLTARHRREQWQRNRHPTIPQKPAHILRTQIRFKPPHRITRATAPAFRTNRQHGQSASRSHSIAHYQSSSPRQMVRFWASLRQQTHTNHRSRPTISTIQTPALNYPLPNHRLTRYNKKYEFSDNRTSKVCLSAVCKVKILLSNVFDS